MNYQDFKSQEEIDAGMDKIVVPSVADMEAAPRDLQRKTVSTMKLALAGVAAFVGYADKSNHEAHAQAPAAQRPMAADLIKNPADAQPSLVPTIAVAATSGNETAASSMMTVPLTPQEISTKMDESRVSVLKEFQKDLVRIEATTGAAQVMQARLLLPRILVSLSRTKNDFEKIALHELCFKIASISGKPKEALQSNMILTPETDLFTEQFFDKEKSILEAARVNPANAKATFAQNEITAELAKRKTIVETMKILAQNPEDTEKNQTLGEYMFFDQGSVKGLLYLAKGNNPLHRVLASKINDPVAWWNATSTEMNPKFKQRMLERALLLYSSNPASCPPEEVPAFEARLKTHAALLKSASQRVTIAIATAAPEVQKPAADSQDKLDSQNKQWIHALQFVTLKNNGSNSSIVSNGRGGIVFKSSDTLDFPFLANGEYDLAIDFVQNDGAGNIVFVIPVGEAQCMVQIGPGFIGIDQVDNERAVANKTKKTIDLKQGELNKMLVSIRKGQAENSVNIKIYLNDALCTEHEGDMKGLSITKTWDRGKYVFAAGNSLKNFELQRFDISMKSGTIKPK